jgi:hypothetical protein
MERLMNGTTSLTEQLEMLSRHLRHLTEGIMEGDMSPNQISDETHDIRITLDDIIDDWRIG